MTSREPPVPKWMRFGFLKPGESSQARVAPSAPPQALTLANFEANFCSEEEKAKFEHSYAKYKIRDIHTIKMVDFVEVKFKYLARFEEFGWMSYLTT